MWGRLTGLASSVTGLQGQDAQQVGTRSVDRNLSFGCSGLGRVSDWSLICCPRQMISHFGDKYFRAINCISTDNQDYNNRENTQKNK